MSTIAKDSYKRGSEVVTIDQQICIEQQAWLPGDAVVIDSWSTG